MLTITYRHATGVASCVTDAAHLDREVRRLRATGHTLVTVTR